MSNKEESSAMPAFDVGDLKRGDDITHLFISSITINTRAIVSLQDHTYFYIEFRNQKKQLVGLDMFTREDMEWLTKNRGEKRFRRPITLF